MLHGVTFGSLFNALTILVISFLPLFWSAALSPKSVVWSRSSVSLCLFCALCLSLARERAKREVRIGHLITLSPHHTLSRCSVSHGLWSLMYSESFVMREKSRERGRQKRRQTCDRYRMSGIAMPMFGTFYS